MGLLSSIFGGGGSNSTSSTTQQTSNDNRTVQDAGGGIAGSGNTFDASTYAYSSNYNDNRSTDSSVRDYSDRRVSVDSSQRDYSDRRVSVDSSLRDYSDRRVDASTVDNSDRSVRIETSDGAFDLVSDLADGYTKAGLAQTAALRDIALKAGTSAGDVYTQALDTARRAQVDAIGVADSATLKAFDLARTSSTQLADSNSAALGFARDTFADVLSWAGKVSDAAGQQAQQAATVAAGAYQSAADTASGNKTLIYVAIGAVALIGAAIVLRPR